MRTIMNIKRFILNVPVISVLVILFASGTPYAGNQYSTISLILCSLLFLFLLFKPEGRLCVDKKAVGYTICLVFMLFASMIVNLDGDLSHYVGKIIVLSIGAICVSVISWNDFRSAFCNVVLFFAVFSLIMYSVGLLNEGFVRSLPTYYMAPTDQYFKSFFHLHQYGYGEDGIWLTTSRNAGMFREPGVFQLYLNSALILLLGSSDSKKFLKTTILCVVILTTVSTSGIIAMLIILAGFALNYLYKEKSITKERFFVIIVIILLIIAVGGYYLENYGQIVFGKFVSGSDNYSSLTKRNQQTATDIRLFWKNPIFGVGYSYYQSFGEGSANSFSCNAALYGIGFVVSLIYGLIRFCRIACEQYPVLAFFSVIAIGSMLFSQNTIFLPVFVVFLYYGISTRKEHFDE